MRKLSFPLSKCKSKKSFKLIYSIFWEQAPLDFFNGYKYVVIFIDDFLRITWLYLLKNKSEIFSQFVDFYNFVKKQFDTKIKTFRSNNGMKFVNRSFIEFFK
jgi:hypothetical protein